MEPISIQWPGEQDKSASQWILNESDQLFPLGPKLLNQIPESDISTWLLQEKIVEVSL